MADSTPKSYHTDPNLYLYTSLTAGSSHIITATSRLETILKANRIPFQALDVATDEKARMLWGRRAGKRKLPGLVRMGMLIGDLEEIEEWNEYGELKEKVGVKPMPSTPSAANTPTKASSSTAAPSLMSNNESPSKSQTSTQTPPRPTASSNTDSPMTTALRQAAMEAAKKAGDAKAAKVGAAKAGAPSNIPTETQQKLDSSGPTGMPPVTGTMDAASAKAPETETGGGVSKADTVSSTEDLNDGSSEEETYEGVGSNDPDKEAVVPDSKDTIDVEDDMKTGAHGIPPEDPDNEPSTAGGKDNPESEDSETSKTKTTKNGDPDAEAVVPCSEGTVGSQKTTSALNTTKQELEASEDDEHEARARGRNTVENITEATTSAEDGAKDLPGKKTQEQASAEPEEAGVSVGD
ncbi:MAG: hypothetical protein Q9218_003693 [Villophora microphyllina]